MTPRRIAGLCMSQGNAAGSISLAFEGIEVGRRGLNENTAQHDQRDFEAVRLESVGSSTGMFL